MGMRRIVMPFVRRFEDRREEVQPAHREGDDEERHPEEPEGLAHPGARHRLGVAGERRVGGPARRGRAAGHEEGGEHDQAGGDDHPVGEHVEERVGHVARADLERDQEVREAGERERHDEEDHQRAVHRHEADVGLGRDLLRRDVGPREARADEHREPARDDRHHHRGHEVLDADDLVVEREHVLAEEALRCVFHPPTPRTSAPS